MIQHDRRNSPQISAARRQRDGGYLLLTIMLMMAFMVITATYYVAPKVVQQIKRDNNQPVSFGYFICSSDRLKFCARVGIWD